MILHKASKANITWDNLTQMNIKIEQNQDERYTFSYIGYMLQIKAYEKLECPEERRKLAKEIYDNFIMKELLAHSHVSTHFYFHVGKGIFKLINYILL